MTSTFLGDRLVWTRDEERAVNAFRKLVMNQGTDSAMRAYAEALSDPIRQQWAESNKLTPYERKERKARDGHWCARQLLGETCKREICGPRDFSGLDHLSTWRREDGRLIYVSQPYGLHSSDLRKFVDLEDRYRIGARVSANQSFYFPGNSLIVEFFDAR